MHVCFRGLKVQGFLGHFGSKVWQSMLEQLRQGSGILGFFLKVLGVEG